MRLGSHVAAEPAIIMGNAGASGVRVKVLNSSFGEMVVNDISALSKLREQFAPGDAVKRAMLSGAEEDATVRRCIALQADCALHADAHRRAR